MLGIGNKKYRDILVKLRHDNRTHTIRAHEMHQTIDGALYNYKYDGKYCTVVIPRNYPVYFDKTRGLRVIGQHYGSNLAVDLFGEFIPDDADVATTVILTSAHIKTTRAIHGEGIKWGLIIVIGLIGLVLAGVIIWLTSGMGGTEAETALRLNEVARCLAI